MRITATRRAPEPVVVLPRFRAELPLLTKAISDIAVPGRPVRVLEAGCGQYWPLELPEVDLHITDVDTDAEAMRIRREKRGDLQEEIVGDLRTVPLPAGRFDVVYCSFVLEHVPGAEEVLDRLVTATRPGGRLIIRVPDGDSVYGALVKHSPHRLHVLYKRHVEGFRDAGKPGHAPYPTVYDPVISLKGLREFARSRGLDVVQEYGVNGLPPRLASIFRLASA